MQKMYIWLDGEFIPNDEVKISVYSHALHYGTACFEGIRSYHGQVFQVEEHIDRLFKSAQILDMDLSLSKELLIQSIKTLVQYNKIDEVGYIRVLVWQASDFTQCSIGDDSQNIHCAILASSSPNLDNYSKRLKLKISSWKRPEPDTMPVHAKASCLYTIGSITKHEVKKQGYDDALFLDIHDNILDSTVANVFFAKNGELYTPETRCCLQGITRDTVIDLARNAGIKVHIRDAIPLQELQSFDEIFLTGTACEITPVVQVEKFEYNIGDVTNLAIELFRNHVRQLLC